MMHPGPRHPVEYSCKTQAYTRSHACVGSILYIQIIKISIHINGGSSREDPAGALFETHVPEITGSDESKLLDTLAPPPETPPQTAVTGGGSFKLLGSCMHIWSRSYGSRSVSIG